MKNVKLILGVFIVCTGLLIALKAAVAGDLIEKGKKVQFDYTLIIDEQVVETSEGKEPLEYVHGEGKIIPGLAAGLEGLIVGDKKSIKIDPKDAYGELLDEAFREFPKDQLPDDLKVEKGTVLELQGPNGENIPGIVWNVKDDTIVINFNHPLAGKILQFDVAIVSIN